MKFTCIQFLNFFKFYLRINKTKMAMPSLESSIRTCKVDTAWASRVESDRFLNPSNMVCPTWNGFDTAGRRVCPDSYWTKRAGCNSAEDRVVVENAQRPQYMEYITLNGQGIAGNMYSSDALGAKQDLANAMNYAGDFGMQMSANIYPGCGVYSYNQAMAQEAQGNRQAQAMACGFNARAANSAAGF